MSRAVVFLVALGCTTTPSGTTDKDEPEQVDTGAPEDTGCEAGLEVCDGVDNDCDGAIDEGVLGQWYPDADADGAGDGTAEAVESCSAPEGHVGSRDDCDDADASIYPGAEEVCDDSIDSDCDGSDEVCPGAPCSDWAPFDQLGAEWAWQGTSGNMGYSWWVAVEGVVTEGERDYWLLSVSGTGSSTFGGYAHQLYESEIAVTCLEDGVHLAYDHWWTSWEAVDFYDESTGSEDFDDQPLWVPSTLAVGDSWDTAGTWLATTPMTPHLERDATSTFTVGDSESITIDGLDVQANRVEVVTSNGGAWTWWLAPGVGPVQLVDEDEVSVVTGFTGL
jgi:hypothetical protein